MIKIKNKKYCKKKNFKNTSSISFIDIIFFLVKNLIIILFLFIIFSRSRGKAVPKNKVHLSLNIDDKYLYPCIVYLTSLLDNKKNSTFYTLHILTNNNLSKNSTNKIDKVIKKFDDYSIELIYYNLEGNFKNATTGYISVATYYKILLPSLLPNIDKIIFTDGDMINLEDLSEMYKIEFKENMYFCGITDFIDHLNQLKEFGLYSDKYINTGVVLINLKALRENSIEKKLIESFILIL